jgi:endonuclease/exonuclease/phosphatase family metal-dependent hydrolase
MVLSRYAISSTRNLPLPSGPAPGEVNDTQAMIEAIVEVGNGLRIYNVHLNYLGEALRLEQIGLMLPLILEAPSRGGPVTLPERGLGPHDEWMVPPPNGRFPDMPEDAILLGDFNCQPQSPELARIVEAGFTNSLALAGLGPEEGVTFPGGGIEPPQRLDHIFLNAGLAPRFVRSWIDERANGSDHQPVWLELDVPG